MFRRSAWEICGGYDESMRSGFEDWDFFLKLLETTEGATIGVVEEPLIEYRTAPASANVKSMSKRLELMRYMIEKHKKIFHEHMTEAILGVEQTSISRMSGWEEEILHEISLNQPMSEKAAAFMENPSYGDGGMAAAVRIATKQRAYIEGEKSERNEEI